jgi:hypothetical protein
MAAITSIKLTLEQDSAGTSLLFSRVVSDIYGSMTRVNFPHQASELFALDSSISFELNLIVRRIQVAKFSFSIDLLLLILYLSYISSVVQSTLSNLFRQRSFRYHFVLDILPTRDVFEP